MPFPGNALLAARQRNYLQYGLELLDQGLEPPALVAFERAAQARSRARSTLYRLGTLLHEGRPPARARTALRARARLQPDLAEASNDLGALLAQDGELPAAIERFRAALAAAPDYPDALNNLGYALLLTGRETEAHDLYEKALALQPDFPEALNNLGIILGRQGDLDRRRRLLPAGAREPARPTARPRTTWRSCSSRAATARAPPACWRPFSRPSRRSRTPTSRSPRSASRPGNGPRRSRSWSACCSATPPIRLALEILQAVR